MQRFRFKISRKLPIGESVKFKDQKIRKPRPNCPKLTTFPLQPATLNSVEDDRRKMNAANDAVFFPYFSCIDYIQWIVTVSSARKTHVQFFLSPASWKIRYVICVTN